MYSETLMQCFHVTSAAMCIAIWAKRTKFVSLGVVNRSEVGSGVTNSVCRVNKQTNKPSY
jgi:hypothetical protein